MKILVFGKTGQVATELQRQSDCIALGRDAANLENPAACAAVIADIKPDIIINAAAYTAVDQAEEQEELANIINGEAPEAMAKQAAAQGIPFLHISTDYVFDGSGDQPRTADANTAPINAYGYSKLLGETGIAAANGPYAILRTAWVFSAHGNNFVKTMLRLAQTRDALTIVDDQFGGPTAAADIAATLLIMAKKFHSGAGKTGIYHYCGAPDTNWKTFAEEIFNASNQHVTVTGIASKNYPAPAKRPQNSRLDCSSLENEFDIKQPDWRRSLQQVLTELEAQK